jgi:glycosyltransferase involved in cell wall biosynthesis
MTFISDQKLHDAFVNSQDKHILMITNHGIHQWDVIPGLPDTGGQNVFVNQFTSSVAQEGYRITIVNRGGYRHPKTDELREGLHYKDERQRILYIEDSKKEFIRKEDMEAQLPELLTFLKDFVLSEVPADLIISHYWDAAKLGVMLNNELPKRVKHVWVPHSLGSVKKRNMNPDTWEDLRIDERISVEKGLIKDLDGIASTSSAIGSALENDYGYPTELFLPPCIEADIFHPREITKDDEVWSFLSEESGLPIEELQECQITMEISRTDSTKRKDVLIKAFAEAHKKFPKTFLIVALDDTAGELAVKLRQLIKDSGAEKYILPIGNQKTRLPKFHAISSVYCSPSVMEGFGMAVQEAAATRVPVIGSALIPFVKEFLVGKEYQTEEFDGMKGPLKIGKGAILVEPDDIKGFALSFEKLFASEELRREMGDGAYDITIPYFTWQGMVKEFFKRI